jgi:hypothetical protein
MKKILSGIIAFFILLYVFLQGYLRFVDFSVFKNQLERTVSSKIGYTVKIGSIKASGLSSICVKDILIKKSGNKLGKINSFVLRLSSSQLLLSKFSVDSISLDGTVLELNKIGAYHSLAQVPNEFQTVLVMLATLFDCFSDYDGRLEVDAVDFIIAEKNQTLFKVDIFGYLSAKNCVLNWQFNGLDSGSRLKILGNPATRRYSLEIQNFKPKSENRLSWNLGLPLIAGEKSVSGVIRFSKTSIEPEVVLSWQGDSVYALGKTWVVKSGRCIWKGERVESKVGLESGRLSLNLKLGMDWNGKTYEFRDSAGFVSMGFLQDDPLSGAIVSSIQVVGNPDDYRVTGSLEGKDLRLKKYDDKLALGGRWSFLDDTLYSNGIWLVSGKGIKINADFKKGLGAGQTSCGFRFLFSSPELYSPELKGTLESKGEIVFGRNQGWELDLKALLTHASILDVEQKDHELSMNVNSDSLVSEFKLKQDGSLVAWKVPRKKNSIEFDNMKADIPLFFGVGSNLSMLVTSGLIRLDSHSIGIEQFYMRDDRGGRVAAHGELKPFADSLERYNGELRITDLTLNTLFHEPCNLFIESLSLQRDRTLWGVVKGVSETELKFTGRLNPSLKFPFDTFKASANLTGNQLGYILGKPLSGVYRVGAVMEQQPFVKLVLSSKGVEWDRGVVLHTLKADGLLDLSKKNIKLENGKLLVGATGEVNWSGNFDFQKDGSLTGSFSAKNVSILDMRIFDSTAESLFSGKGAISSGQYKILNFWSDRPRYQLSGKSLVKGLQFDWGRWLFAGSKGFSSAIKGLYPNLRVSGYDSYQELSSVAVDLELSAGLNTVTEFSDMEFSSEAGVSLGEVSGESKLCFSQRFLEQRFKFYKSHKDAAKEVCFSLDLEQKTRSNTFLGILLAGSVPGGMLQWIQSVKGSEVLSESIEVEKPVDSGLEFDYEKSRRDLKKLLEGF